MKKLVCILLAMVMVLALNVPAFAAENTTTLTINGETGRKYAGYQLLEVTTSLKTGEHHTAHEGNHNDDCYNFAYTVREKYRTVLQAEVFDYGGNYLWGEGGKPGAPTAISDDQILKYLDNQTETMRLVADRIYRGIRANNIDADKTDLDGKQNTIEQGYWLFADVTELEGNAANSLVMVGTKGQDNLTINSKTGLPTVEKKVKDIDDTEDDNILDNAWHDSADHDINDVIPFKLTATMPSNVQNYQDGYTIIFHDTLSEGLTLNKESFKVYMYETKHKADVDTDLNEYLTDGAKDVTAQFVLKTEGLTDDCTFEIGCENVKAIEGVTKDTAFVVYYEATLNGGAKLGAAGNPNTVYLEFSNNPYGAGTGKTEVDVVNVFTYQLVINKTDSHGHALDGAGFTLSKKNIDGTYKIVDVKNAGEGITSFVWTGLDDGDYLLQETTVPAGFNKMSDIAFSISAIHAETDGVITLTELDGGLIGMGDVNTGVITKAIENKSGTVLPETGAAGTMWLILGGAMLVVVAGVFMITRKKMSVYED